MPDHLLVATDLDRTLIPNGPEPESKLARTRFAALVSQPGVTLAYVSGRHRELVERAIRDFRLAMPDFVIGDVGTSIYQLDADGRWQRQEDWERDISRDWQGRRYADLAALLRGTRGLRLQERARQNQYKLSYYVPLKEDRKALSAEIRDRLAGSGIQARLVWSTDDPVGTGLLDILPQRASKFHAIEALMRARGFGESNTVFCGDSGNDLEVLASPIPAVLVANARPEVRARAITLAEGAGHESALYLARGGFLGMNGNYGAGMLEGIAHYHSDTVPWMTAQDGNLA